MTIRQRLGGLFPSRLTVAAVVGCAVLIPLVAVTGRSAIVANAALDRAEARVVELDRQIQEPVTGYIARLATCRSSLGSMEAGVKTQNAAIEGLRQRALESEARAEAAVRGAQAQARATERRAQAVLQARPRDGEGQCDAAYRLHQENLQ